MTVNVPSAHAWVGNSGNDHTGTASGDSSLAGFMNPGATGGSALRAKRPKWNRNVN